MTIELQSPAQKACYKRVTPWIKEIFGEVHVRMRDDAPMAVVSHGSAAVYVSVWPWADDEAVIQARAYVVTGVEPTSELMHYLLHQNDQMRFGAFGLDKDNDIYIEYTIVGSTVDREELRAATVAVAVAADEYDDKIYEGLVSQSEAVHTNTRVV